METNLRVKIFVEQNWRLLEITPIHRLQWANEVPGNLCAYTHNTCIQNSYFLVKKGTFTSFGNANEFYSSTSGAVGSLSNIRQRIEKLGVDKKGKDFSRGEEFIVHAFHDHLAASLSSPDDLAKKQSFQWLQSKAAAIVEATIMPATSHDTAYYLHRCFMHGAQIIRLWKHWLLYFLGAGRKKYTLEATFISAEMYLPCRTKPISASAPVVLNRQLQVHGAHF